MSPRVVAVVVTYNRRELLATTLRGIASSAVAPTAVVVVDNASTDGTAEYLASVELPIETDVVTLGVNVGGAGGFVVGMERALLDHHAEYIWVMDDDTEPHESTLGEALETSERYAEQAGETPAFIASKVVWSDGRDHPMNRMRLRVGSSDGDKRLAESVGGMQVRTASFVSLLVPAAEVRRHGLPIADYFIWNDDLEYTARISRRSPALLAHASVATHHTASYSDARSADPGPRFYYEVRNKVWVYSRSSALTPSERLLYTGASMRNWTQILWHSKDKRGVVQTLYRGLRDGMKAPRDNDEVLRGIYPLRPLELTH